MIDNYRILTNGKKYKVQRRYSRTLLLRREVWEDETETHYTVVGDCDWASETTPRLFDTYPLALDYVQACEKQDEPEIWRVVSVCGHRGES